MIKEYFDWIRNKFQHPMIFFFIAFGAFLIFLGLVGSITIPVLKELGTQSKISSQVFGFVFILFAMFLVYRPPPAWKNKSGGSSLKKSSNAAGFNSKTPQKWNGAGIQEPDGKKLSDPDEYTPQDRKKSFLSLRAGLSTTQSKILTFVERKKKLSLSAIKEELAIDNDAELYYRMEQLRLLGFIDKEKIVESANSVIVIYKLTDSYGKQWNKLVPDETLRY